MGTLDVFPVSRAPFETMLACEPVSKPNLGNKVWSRLIGSKIPVKGEKDKGIFLGVAPTAFFAMGQKPTNQL